MDRPLLLGSVKSNIGHLEAAAGIAGLIKVVLSLRAGEIPGQAHFRTPNPHIAWSELPVEVVRSRRGWPAGRRIAGVSSFGFSGTNAHVVVEGYVEPAAGPAAAEVLPERSAHVLALSGKSEAALSELAGRYGDWLAATPDGSRDGSLGDLCFTAGVGRSHFAHRAAVVAGTREELAGGLAALRAGTEHDALRVGPRRDGPRRGQPRVGVLFTGQGSQWAGMARGLYAAEPVFREVVDRCCAASDEAGQQAQRLRDVLFAEPGTALAALLDDTSYTQAALYALQSGLWALWRSWGLQADAVIGHSVGEFAAAHAAGVLSLEDGARLVARRGALMGALPAGGAMAVVFAPAAAVATAVARTNGGLGAGAAGLSLAGENGTHRVVSGPSALVEALVTEFAEAGVRCQRLTVSHAFHSALLDPMLDGLEAAAAAVTHRAPRLALVSNLTGAAFPSGTQPDAAYWRRHAREPVRYAEGVATLAAMGVDVLLELGPRPVLGPLALGCWPGAAPVALSSLRPGIADDRALAEAVAGLYAAGGSVDFAAREAGRGRRRVALPGYPFERVRHWIETPKRRVLAAAGHPLLGVEHRSASGEVSWTQELSATEPGWVMDHTVFGTVLVPGALHACLAAATGLLPVSVRDGQIEAPLVLTEQAVALQLLLQAPDAASGAAGRRAWRVFARAADAAPETPWRLHASGQVVAAGPLVDEAPLPMTALSERDVGVFYNLLAGLGIGYGPSFQGVERLWGGPGVARGEIAAPEGVAGPGAALHPTVLDACLQVLMAALPEDAGLRDPYVPLGWEALELWAPAPRRVVCEVRLRGTASAETAVADLWLRDAAGVLFGRMQGLMLKRATRQALLGAAAGVEELLYEVVWREVPVPAAAVSFLAAPSALVEVVRPRIAELSRETDFDAGQQARLDALLERSSRVLALDGLCRLGWSPQVGETIEAEALRVRLGVLAEHARLFGRLLSLLGEAGVLVPEDAAGAWRVVAAELAPGDTAEAVSREAVGGVEGAIAWVLLSRCGAALAEVLRGEVAPLGLLFPEHGVGAADLYREAPAARLMNRLLAASIERAVADLPAGQRLRVLEVGAGTGGTSGEVLPLLPRDRTEYVYTDVSAGFFAGAETRFGAAYPFVAYRALDIERDPASQGFAAGGYDLVIASNVLHATRDVVAAAAHCRALLAPGGMLVLLEELQRRGWADLTFGLLEGWWRFADAPLRQEHALLDTARWQLALAAAGFAETALLHADAQEAQAVVLARKPLGAEAGPSGLWLLASGQGDAAEPLAMALAARGQHVVLAGPGATLERPESPGRAVDRWRLRMNEAADWRVLLAALPAAPPLRGVVHLAALDAMAADAAGATTARLAADTEASVGSALSLSQALIGHDVSPSAGVWFVTEGAQVVAGEPGGRLAGAALWGMVRTLAHEHPELNVRRLDLEAGIAIEALLEELLEPDGEDEVARRGAARLAPRLVRAGREAERLALPVGSGWRLAKGSERTLAALRIEAMEAPPPGPGEVQVAIEAAGLNFRDVLDALGMVPVDAGPLGGEFAGRVLAVGEGVEGLVPGEPVIGLGAGCFSDRVTTPAVLLAPCPRGVAPAAAATLPIVSLTAALAFELAELRHGDRVLIHAGAGGVGLAAIQLARAAGAEVFATASAAKRGYLRGLGVAHVYDSRSTGFAAEILAASEGRGVDVVLNSLTSEGFVAASLSALAPGGRFVEIAKRGIWTAAEVAAVRPDVVYHILAVDRLMAEEPERTGAALRAVLAQVATGVLRPLPYTSYPMGEARLAMRRMQQGGHIGKIVLLAPMVPAGAAIRAGVTYLITGGLGGIGLAVAGWLADRGATHLALNGRRAPSAAAEAAVAALRQRGVTVEILLADVAQAAEVDSLLTELDARMPALAGVIHSVGLLRDGAVANQDWNRFAEVLGPKQLGGWQLHRATQDRALDLFVLFSSTAGLLGNRGQANHAAANVFLDQLARHRRALGLAGLSIDWGAWSEIGEAAERREALDAVMAAAGISWMAPAQGLAALDRALAGEAAQLGVVAAEWQRVGNSRAPGATSAGWPLLAELLAAERAAQAPARPAQTAAIRQRLARTPAAQQRNELLAWLGEALQRILRLPEPPEAGMRFSDLGMDSLMTVELRNRLNAELRLDPPLPATVLFDYPTIDALANSIEQLLDVTEPDQRNTGKRNTVSKDPVPATSPAPREILDADTAERSNGRTVVRDREASRQSENVSGAIAIVGMACRFPLAPNLAAYWRLLVEGTDAIAPIPPARSDVAPVDDPEDGSHGRKLPRWAGLLEEVEYFDPLHFKISPTEAPYIDPQHRLLLEATWHAFEDAGIPPAELAGSQTGVFIGIGAADYAMRHANDLDALTTHSGAGSGGFAAANRISHAFDLTGPSFAVNTACASSLTALHLAVTSLKAGECDFAIVGGVNLMLHPAEFVSLFKAQVLSPTGRCRSFSVGSDGYVRSEGCGVVLLRRYTDAVAAGRRIDAVIRGTAISHVGASNGLSAPNGPAQEAVMRAAAARAGVDPACIDYLEAQGTGTPIGDAIEMGAIRNVMGVGRDPEHWLRIGAVKTNIGNTEEASGMAGLIKTVLAMKHGVIPPTLHFSGLHSNIRIGNANIRVVTEPEPWLRGPSGSRIAAVNGFGFAGANVHVVLQESEPAEAHSADDRLPLIIAVRARTPANLRRMAAAYADALAGCLPADVQNFCFSANTGRGDLGHRLAVVGADRATLVSRLRAAAEGATGPSIHVSEERGLSQRRRRVAFLFSGHEALDKAPIADLYAEQTVFREVLDRCAICYAGLGEGSLLDLLTAPPAGALSQALYAQPALYGLQVALAALWESWGVRPDFVLGHGVGEVAAAVCAEVLDLENGMILAVGRGRLMSRLPTPTGAELQAFEALTARLPHGKPRRRLLMSTENLRPPESDEGWQEYWREHATRPDDFLAPMGRADETSADIFIEIGPQANLIEKARRGGTKRNALYLASLQTGHLPERAALIETLAALFAAGCMVDFSAVDGGSNNGGMDVPLYPFERQRYTLEDALRAARVADGHATRNAMPHIAPVGELRT